VTSNQKTAGTMVLGLCFAAVWAVALFTVLTSWWDAVPMPFWAASSLAFLALGRVCHLLDAVITLWSRIR